MDETEYEKLKTENERLKKENEHLRDQNSVLSYGYHRMVNEETKRRIASWNLEKKETTWREHQKETKKE